MVTNQLMTRKMMGNFEVLQRTKDGYFNATALLDQWNKLGTINEKRVDEFLRLDSTEELLCEIQKREGNSKDGQSSNKSDFQAVRHSRTIVPGKKGRPKDNVYMHPILFIDFAMWINPKFRYDVIKFCYDQMIKFRNDAGDAYKELSAAVASIVRKEDMPARIAKVSQGINYIVFGDNYHSIRNDHGSEEKQQELFALEKKIADLINDGFVKDFDSLMDYLRTLWKKKYYPEVFKKQ